MAAGRSIFHPPTSLSLSMHPSTLSPGRSCISQMVKNLPAMQETQVQSLGWEDTLEKGMVTHSSILAWTVLWTEDPGGLQSMGSDRTEGLTLHIWRPESKEPDLSGCSGAVLPDISEFSLLVYPNNPPPGSFPARAIVLQLENFKCC